MFLAEDEIACAVPVRFLLAANLGALGFADAAIEILDEIEQGRPPGLNTAALRLKLTGKPPTRLKGLSEPVWRTADGACLWCEGDRLIGCDAQRDADRSLKEMGLVPGMVPSEHLPPLLIAGMSTPLLLQRAIEATPTLANGFTPRIIVVEPDAARADRANSMMPPEAETNRVMLFIGPGAVERAARDLHSRLDCALPRGILRDPLITDEWAEAIHGILRDAQSEHDRQVDLALSDLARRSRSAESACKRIRHNLPLQVLIPVSRHSSFVHHSAKDIQTALEELGHTVRILDEHDSHSTLSKLGYLHAGIEVDPDLILLINHPRWRLGNALPPGSVSVCWIQDAMPHLFEDVRGKQSEYDFVAGYRLHELIERYGYRADRMIDAPLPISRTKFHTGPVAADLEKRYAYDVAFVTRQSESPEVMVDRLRRESAGCPVTHKVIGLVYERLRSEWTAHRLSFRLDQLQVISGDALRDSDGACDAQSVDEVTRLVVMPLADRILRHVVIEWAAEICEVRGLRFALYGSGWESHPKFSRYARGELEHGEHLRAAYRSAAVHLHASAHSLVHQRVLECAMSGGTMLCYRRSVDLIDLRWKLLANLARSAAPDEYAVDGSALYYGDRHPEVRRHLERWSRFAPANPDRRNDAVRIHSTFLEHFRSLEVEPLDHPGYRMCSEIVDHASFSTKDELGEMIDLALRDRQSFDRSRSRICESCESWYTATSAMTRVLQAIASCV